MLLKEKFFCNTGFLLAIDDKDNDGIDISIEDEEEEPKVVRIPFNPMISYVEMAFGILILFVTLALFGYEIFTIVSLFFVIFIYRESYYVFRTYPSGFVKNGAIFNSLHSTVWFLIMVINVYTTQFGSPLILPEITNLLDYCALFILMAFFGMRNIIRMYVPAGTVKAKYLKYPS